MARALNLADIIIIAILIIIAAVLIYLLRPLIIVIVIISAGYFIYRWYIKRKLLRSWLFVDRKRARKIFSLLNIYFKLSCSNQASLRRDSILSNKKYGNFEVSTLYLYKTKMSIYGFIQNVFYIDPFLQSRLTFINSHHYKLFPLNFHLII